MDIQRWRTAVVVFCLNSVLAPFATAGEQTPQPYGRGVLATFSIMACDLTNRQWGVVMQSRILAIGSIVPFAREEVGAIATQSWSNTTFGPRGLKMLSEGKPAQETLDSLLLNDAGHANRQVAIIDRQGRIAHFTGEMCLN